MATPNTPVSLRILNQLVLNLKKIQKGASYFNDVAEVKVIKDVDFNIQEFPTILIVPIRTRQDPRPLNVQTIKWTIEIWAYYRVYEDITEQTEQMLHDISKAVLADPRYENSGSCLAVDTDIQRSEVMHLSEAIPFVSTITEIEVHYRQTRLDPSEAR